LKWNLANLSPSWLQTTILQTSASQVGGITGVRPGAQPFLGIFLVLVISLNTASFVSSFPIYIRLVFLVFFFLSL
jgi:hypothetical protein